MAEDVKGRLWCVGDPLRLCGAPDRVWIDLEDGWQVRMTKEGPEPESLAYVTPWAGHVPIRDGEGRAWKAPRILSQSGDTIFRVRYGGKSWLPILSEAQQAAESCARAARASFLSTEREVPREAACAWAESFLRVLHPISPGAIAALGLLDDPLIVGVLKVAAGQVDD
jgi:hypothetical protein